MRFRLTLGAALLSTLVALNAGPVSAQNARPGGTICVENAGAFVITTVFMFYRELQQSDFEDIRDNRSIVGAGYSHGATMRNYPVLQTRCADFNSDDRHVNISIQALFQFSQALDCTLDLNRFAGRTTTIKAHGTIFDPNLDCPR